VLTQKIINTREEEFEASANQSGTVSSVCGDAYRFIDFVVQDVNIPLWNSVLIVTSALFLTRTEGGKPCS